jgi:hypothetical protein
MAARYEASDGAQERGTGRTYTPVALARRHLYSGQYDRAIARLEKAYQNRDPALPCLGLPLYDAVRSDLRFVDLPRRMSPPPGCAFPNRRPHRRTLPHHRGGNWRVPGALLLLEAGVDALLPALHSLVEPAARHAVKHS